MTTPTTPLTFTAEEIAAHLRWKLSNSNSEIDRGDGTVLDVAFNAWSDEGGTPVFELHVSGWDQDSGRRGEQSFRVTVVEETDREDEEQ